VVSGGYYLMSCIKDVPILRGDNYTEWRKKVDLAFVCAEVDWVVDMMMLLGRKSKGIMLH
jgi:hypothetical protein